MRHVIWDWNGTLFDDLPIVVDAVNASLAELGAGPIDANGYRDHYTRPVYRFYESMLGREVTAAEWERIDVIFHDVYRSRLDDAALAADAEAAMSAVHDAGSTQSLLSMWWHDELVAAAGRYGIDGRMLRIDGNRGAAGETKAHHLSTHLVALRDARPSLTPERCLVVGDSLDDALAAARAGVPCVLYDGGSHHRAELDAAGVPVAESLLQAIERGGL